MGKRLNALLGRSSSASKKLRTVANLAVSRIAILRNLHGVRCSQARSDVIQLLHQQPHQHHALVRVEQVIKEQNSLDALVMIEMCCHILKESTEIITNSRECPDEVKEAVSSLIFAASRTGEFPELQEIRRIFTSKYGKDFAYSAVELRNGCRVYPKLVEGLSTERASMETRQNLLKQIAKENGITLELSRNIDLQEESEDLKDIPMKDDYHEVAPAAGDAIDSDGAVAAGDAFDSDDDGFNAMCGSDDEEIIENLNVYNVQTNAEMSEDKVFDAQVNGKTIHDDTP
ncbi:IST1-like protein [Salvia hispanica]|uniref:IST1-like protein n=1 Tax=Salvia hispanica TaxID=49212 RepID=UPI0020098F49|nr:IST1-like protein [Salvia hispanica]